MAALKLRRRSVRRAWTTGLTLTAFALFAVIFVAASSANLPGSSFEGNDGNLIVNGGAGAEDWANAPNRVRGDDLASGKTDNAFGQGTKEDDPNVSVVTGSVPPNKSDLTRFYVASEFANNSNFLYLAWERSNVLGSANMDFEINKLAQPDLTAEGSKTLNRSAGDLLITFDFNNGGGSPALGLLKWVTSGATSQCFSSNSLPCWGNRVDLSGLGEAEGAVNDVTVTDPIAGVSLPALTFGEAAVNLTAAGVFAPGTCTAFGSVFLKSRSSASFPAEVKDFVAPQPVNISNCGEVIIKKRTDPRGVDKAFSFTSNLAGAQLSCTQSTATSFSLNDNGNTSSDSSSNTQDCTNVPAGSYTVTEGADPAGFAFKDPGGLTCTASTGSSGSQDAANKKKANITLAAGGVVTCVYVNVQQRGAIKITKTSIKGPTPLAGAKFSITSGGNPIAGSPFTTDSNGVVCVDNLAFGDYVVTETAAPSGYAIDDPSARTVTVDNTAKCSDSTYVGESESFSDTPLTDILAKAKSQASGGTQSSISCVDEDGADVGDSPDPNTGFGDPAQVTANGLKPGTYVCTIVIDP